MAELPLSIPKCRECYELNYVSCPAYISLNGNIDPGGGLFLWVIDKNNHKYILPLDSVSGSPPVDVTIDFSTSEPPADEISFNHAAGYFEAWLSENNERITDTPINIDGVDYNCFIIKFDAE